MGKIMYQQAHSLYLDHWRQSFLFDMSGAQSKFGTDAKEDKKPDREPQGQNQKELLHVDLK